MMEATFILPPEAPPIAARGNVTFYCAPTDLLMLDAWLDALGFVRVLITNEREYGRWRSPDHESLLVAWRGGTLLCQGAKPGWLASLLRAQIKSEQLSLFDLADVENGVPQ